MFIPDPEARAIVKATLEPQFVAYNVETGRYREFRDAIEASRFFKVKPITISKTTSVNDTDLVTVARHKTGKNINQAWLIFNADDSFKYVEEILIENGVPVR